MLRGLTSLVVLVVVGWFIGPREACSTDDLSFATPAVADYTPACVDGVCPVVTPSRVPAANYERRRMVFGPRYERAPVRQAVRRVGRWFSCRGFR